LRERKKKKKKKKKKEREEEEKNDLFSIFIFHFFLSNSLNKQTKKQINFTQIECSCC